MSVLPDPIAIDRAHGGSVPNHCIDFSTSLNPLGPPPEAIGAYREAVARISKYPAPYPRRLEARIAAWLGIDPETVIAANGSTRLIYLLAQVLRLRSPLVVIPTFSEIANALHGAGSRPLPISTRAEDNFGVGHGALRQALEAGGDAIVVGRPNSPTGTFIGLDETAAVARQCAGRRAWCVLDEAFIEFADEPQSAVALVGSIPRLIVLRSLTKIFAIPGLRLGYLVANAGLVHKLREAIEPWSVNSIAEHVALACLDVAERAVAQARHSAREERLRLVGELGRLPRFSVLPSSANFLMFFVEREQAAGDFGRYMLGQGMAVRDLSGVPGCGRGFYRIGVRSRADNDCLVAAAANYSGR